MSERATLNTDGRHCFGRSLNKDATKRHLNELRGAASGHNTKRYERGDRSKTLAAEARPELEAIINLRQWSQGTALTVVRSWVRRKALNLDNIDRAMDLARSNTVAQHN
jgi:hypothetical protein